MDWLTRDYKLEWISDNGVGLRQLGAERDTDEILPQRARAWLAEKGLPSGQKEVTELAGATIAKAGLTMFQAWPEGRR